MENRENQKKQATDGLSSTENQAPDASQKRSTKRQMVYHLHSLEKKETEHKIRKQQNQIQKQQKNKC